MDTIWLLAWPHPLLPLSSQMWGVGTCWIRSHEVPHYPVSKPTHRHEAISSATHPRPLFSLLTAPRLSPTVAKCMTTVGLHLWERASCFLELECGSAQCLSFTLPWGYTRKIFGGGEGGEKGGTRTLTQPHMITQRCSKSGAYKSYAAEPHL